MLPQIRSNQVGVTENHSNQDIPAADAALNFFHEGWARYPKQTPNTPMKLETVLLLKEIFTVGSKQKSKRMSAERAHAIFVEQSLTNGLIEPT